MNVKLVSNWNFYLERFSSFQKDIYYQEEYVKLYQGKSDKAVCFVYEECNKCLLFPYLLRECLVNGVSYYDFETAYGYGGPIANTNDIDFISRALNAFYYYGQTHRYIAGFVRFHPLLNNTLSFDSIGNIFWDRNTVAIDLNKNIDSIWAEEVHTKNRNIIKKGYKNGLRFIADYQYTYLEDFIRLYNNTMDKLSADSFYYFDYNYYYQLKKNIPNSFLGVILYGEEVISAAIFFYSEDYAHYHLSGSNKDWLRLYPNNLMLWEATKELKKHGVQKFHLGGGTDSDDNNSLYNFKKKFSKSFYSFQIGKVVFDQVIYEQLCSQWIRNNPNKKGQYGRYLLKYKY